MSQMKVTFIEAVEGPITHGGVVFTPGKAVELDPSVTEMSPWFAGNRSFHIEEVTNEAPETVNSKSAESAGDSHTGEGAGSVDQGAEKADSEVKPVTPKRVRKKVVPK